jgi:hypothetical protein
MDLYKLKNVKGVEGVEEQMNKENEFRTKNKKR